MRATTHIIGHDLPSSRSRRRRNAEGFTLAELLVAMALLGLLSAMLFGGLRFGARSWESVVDRSAELDRIVAAQAFLRDRFSQARKPLADEGDVAEAAFSGDAEHVSFTSPWLSAISQGGLYQFRLSYTGEDDGRVLLAWRPQDIEAAENDEALGELVGERALFSNVAAFELSYFGAAPGATEPEWIEEWRHPTDAPQRVRISMSFADETLVWPKFVVEPKFRR
jgi:general secretion pathway protein J